MEMRANEAIDIGQYLTTAFLPLSFSLYDSLLSSHCSACSSSLPPPHGQFAPLLPTSHVNSHHVPNPSLLYCSLQCSSSDSALHLSSAEHDLLVLRAQSHPASSLDVGDTSDLRAALRLLHRFETLGFVSRRDGPCLPERIGGLMSNRERITTCDGEEEGEVLARIKAGAKAMAAARLLRDGLDLEFFEDCLLEEVMLCLVLTNAVEVQVNQGCSVGIAVYDATFSWINHSCSPTACYRFLLPEASLCSSEQQLRITPAASCGGNVIEVTQKGYLEYGPRVIVRSIKAMKKGQEVSIAYTDLLQPKAMRQSELWLKYRFICCCKRCNVWPPAYVDHTLQEIFVTNLDFTNLSSDHNFYRDEAIKKLNDYVDDTISEYLSFGNPESCCEKLENILAHGLLDDLLAPKKEKSEKIFRLHPLHHLSLNAYTTLASVYKIRATDLLADGPDLNEHELEAFDMSRSSAAYSLLLAGGTHHLFLSESSLIASVANFWISAGESLLSLARSSAWNLFMKCGLVSGTVSFPSQKCCKCAFMDKFETKFVSSHAGNADFEQISTEFLTCVKESTPKVWSFLTCGGCHLKATKDPIDFRWLKTLYNFETLDSKAHLGSTSERDVSGYEMQGNANQVRVDTFQLGVHCLQYGGFLSAIYHGEHSYSAPYIQNLLYGESYLTDENVHQTN